MLRPPVPRALGASIFAAAALIASTSAAQEPASNPDLPFRLDLDLIGSLTYRLGSTGGVLDRGGGLLGLNVLAGPQAARWSAGLGYERSFLGKETIDNEEAGTLLKVGRGLDALWVLGRGYAYEDADLSVYVTLGLAPVWQRISVNGTVTDTRTGATRSVSCSVSDSAGLGLRLGVGTQLAINDYLGFHAGLGVDHQRLSEDTVEGCGPGLGGSTFLGARFGFTITAGRTKSAPPPPPRPAPVFAPAPAPAPVPAPVSVPVPAPAPPPPDRDGDKVIDEQDACPDIPGVATTDPATNGCPPDTDGDGIRDDKDACPDVKGAPNEDPAKHGCPLVVFTEKEIVIAQQVQFETDRAVIRAVSDGLLDEVASVIKQHPEILKMEVQGHTDNSGTKFRNKQLSKDRAEAVRKALVKRGVDPNLLESKGYGDSEPIAGNETPEGRSKNRRVQFKILQKR